MRRSGSTSEPPWDCRSMYKYSCFTCFDPRRRLEKPSCRHGLGLRVVYVLCGGKSGLARCKGQPSRTGPCCLVALRGEAGRG